MVSGTARLIVDRLLQSGAAAKSRRLEEALRAAAPALLFGLRLWASVSLALYVAFWLELDNPFWAGTSAAIVCQPQLGASLRKGWFRMIGSVIGAAMSVLLVACFPHERILFLGGIAVWCAACAFAATVLHNFASYSAALAGYTVAIIAGDLLGATGGVDANAAFLLAVSRASEICLGIVCAGVVLAGTDFGGARRLLAAQFADMSAAIAAGLARTLAMADRDFDDTQAVRREFVRRVVALDPAIDQTLGESAQIRYHSPVLQGAVDGLFNALCGWRAIANHLHMLPEGEARQAAATVLEALPPESRWASQPGAQARWMSDPVALRRCFEQTARRLGALPAATPSLRLLADQTAGAFAGIAQALNGLALLAGDPARPAPRRGSKHVRVPDWLPAEINAGRAFVTIGGVVLFWIVTAWPGGANAITFAAVVALLLAPRAEQAYAAAILLIVGAILTLVLTAIVEFAVLPAVATEGFESFSLVLAVCLVPIGALLAQARKPWQVGLLSGMTLLFVPLLQPTNPMTYNVEVFYNTGLIIVFGAGFAALMFRLLPPLTPAFRARRLLALTLRDLRRVAAGGSQDGWDDLVLGRLAAMPDQATPLQRAQLLAAAAAGGELVRLRHAAQDLGFGADLGAALAALPEGRSARAILRLSQLDAALAAGAADRPGSEAVQHARGGILALSEALAKHAAYFDAGAHA